MSGKSRVYLISVGSEPAELITVKVLRHIQQADVIIYDHRVTAEVVALIPYGTTRILAGRQYGAHHHPHEFYELLLRLAPDRCVVYLKGEDTAAAGSAREAAHFLARYGIVCERVPRVVAPESASPYPEARESSRVHYL